MTQVFCSQWKTYFWVIAITSLLTVTHVESNVPLFTLDNDIQVLFLPKDTKNGTAIYRFSAWDSDNQFPLTFRIDSQGAQDIFSIVAVSDRTADLILQRPLPQSGDIYEVPIVVTDTANEFTRRVFRINVTDARGTPDNVFINYQTTYTVSENAPMNTIIGKVTARSIENNSLTVNLSIKGSNLFNITSVLTNAKFIVSGEIVLMGKLDYETQSFYELQIEALNGYVDKTLDTRNVIYLPILIVVKDEQDTPPIFTELPTVVRISNDAEANTKVAQVRAIDGDTDNQRAIRYSVLPDLDQGNAWQFFQIDPNSGEITLKKSALDISQATDNSPVILNIKAEEAGAPPMDPLASTIKQIVFLLDSRPNQAPKFAQDFYEGEIEEHAPPFSLISITGVTSVTDNDLGLAGVFTLSLEDETDGQNVDHILEVTPSVIVHEGVFQVRVRNSALLDYERFQELTFKVVAKDLAEPVLSSSSIVVLHIKDINDNSPVFTKDPYEVSVPEDVRQGTLIVQVTATDADSGVDGQVTYTKLTGDLADKLHLDPQTGRITVSSSDHGIDRERQAEHVLQVEASDSGIPPRVNSTTVRIKVLDVNDNAPQFKKGVYQVVVAPDIPLTEPFLQVEAVDADEPGTSNSMVRYEILRGNRGDMFRIDPVTGELSLSKVPSTRNEESNSLTNNEATEDQSLYILTVRAYDMGIPHQNSTVVVYIHFKTDNPGFMNGTIQYIFPASVAEVNRDRERIERFLSKLNGAFTMIDQVTPYDEPYEGIRARSVFNEKSLVVTTVRFHKKSLVDLSAVARELNGSLPISGDATNENQVVEAGVDYGWKVALITLLVLLAVILLILICFCFWRQFRKLDDSKVHPIEDKLKEQHSHVTEVITATSGIQGNFDTEKVTERLIQNGKTVSENDETDVIKRSQPATMDGRGEERRLSAGLLNQHSRQPHVHYSRHLHGSESLQGRGGAGNIRVERHEDHGAGRHDEGVLNEADEEIEELVEEGLKETLPVRGQHRPFGAYRLGTHYHDDDDELEEVIVIEPDGGNSRARGGGDMGAPVRRVRRIIKRSPSRRGHLAFHDDQEVYDDYEDTEWVNTSLPDWLGKLPTEYVVDYDGELGMPSTSRRNVKGNAAGRQSERGRRILVRKYRGGGGSLPGDRFDEQWVGSRSSSRPADDQLTEYDRRLWNTTSNIRARPRHRYRIDRSRALTRTSFRAEDDSDEDLAELMTEESQYVQNQLPEQNNTRGLARDMEHRTRNPKTLRFGETTHRNVVSNEEWEADIEDELDRMEKGGHTTVQKDMPETRDQAVGHDQEMATISFQHIEEKPLNKGSQEPAKDSAVSTQSRAVSARPLEDFHKDVAKEMQRTETTLSNDQTGSPDTKNSSTTQNGPSELESEASPRGPDSGQSEDTSEPLLSHGQDKTTFNSSNPNKKGTEGNKFIKGKRESRYMDWYKNVDKGTFRPKAHCEAMRKKRQRLSPINRPHDDSGEHVADETKGMMMRRRGSDPLAEDRHHVRHHTTKRSDTALDVMEGQIRLGGNRFIAEDDEDSGIGHNDSYRSSKKQFLEKRSLFTIAYNQNKQEALKDRDSSANGTSDVNRIT